MKQKFIPVVVIAALLALAAFFPPRIVQGAPEDEAAAVVAALVTEIAEQQTRLIENQKAIDAALAEVKEELRLARIFSARSGGGKASP